MATASCTGGGSSIETAPSTPTDAVPTETLEAVGLQCDEAIDSIDAPRFDWTVVLGVVALPASPAYQVALQTIDSGETDPAARLWAETGLLVRADSAFELAVPPERRERLSIGWGSPVRRTWDLTVPGCDGQSDWLAFAGGFWVRDPDCMPLIVRRGEREALVLIGIGAPCPGQEPAVG
jgi:hypothetical protein